MKALPPQLDIPFSTESEYWAEILNQCAAPSATKYRKVRLISHSHFKVPQIGIVRPFNPVDFKRLYEKYNSEISFKIQGIPDMSAVYDFFPYIEKDGRKQLSVTHSHVSIKQFEYLDTQMKLIL